MPKIKLYIATTIDGYIARSNGDFDWLTDYPITSESDYGYNEFYNSIGTVIMGANTYHSILSMDVEWAYKDKDCYVITRNENIRNPHIKLITDDVIESIKSLKGKSNKDIWLVGGGQIVSLLLTHNLLDEIIITTVPILLGSGIPLFPQSFVSSNWKISSIKKYDNGLIQSCYIRV